MYPLTHQRPPTHPEDLAVRLNSFPPRKPRCRALTAVADSVPAHDYPIIPRGVLVRVWKGTCILRPTQSTRSPKITQKLRDLPSSPPQLIRQSSFPPLPP